MVKRLDTPLKTCHSGRMMKKLKTLIRILEGIGFCFMCAFDKQFMEEARAEQEREQWEKENNWGIYAK
jgi:hypothetical protein